MDQLHHRPAFIGSGTGEVGQEHESWGQISAGDVPAGTPDTVVAVREYAHGHAGPIHAEGRLRGSGIRGDVTLAGDDSDLRDGIGRPNEFQLGQLRQFAPESLALT